MRNYGVSIIGVFLLIIGILSMSNAAEPGMVAHYDFNQGSGIVLKDTSGNGNDGNIHDAAWVRSKNGGALKFKPTDSYVDCGKFSALNIAGDMTILAWVKLEASPFPTNDTNWTIICDEEYNKSGFMIRADGTTSQFVYRASQSGSNTWAQSKTYIENNQYHLMAFIKKGEYVSWFVDGVSEMNMKISNPAPSTGSLYISEPSQSFQGLIDDLKIYNYALSISDVFGVYKKEAGIYGKDISWVGNIRLDPFYYFKDKQIVLRVDFTGILPWETGDTAVLEMGPVGGQAVETIQIIPLPEFGKSDYTLSMDKLTKGKQEIRVFVKKGSDVRAKAVLRFDYPQLQAKVPSPKNVSVKPIPSPPALQPYSIRLTDGGGLVIKIKGEEYPVESSFSFPYGGENKFTTNHKEISPEWHITSKKLNQKTYQVTGVGKFYKIVRNIKLYPNRIYIKDKIINQTDEPIGIILDNRVQGSGFTEGTLAGNSVTSLTVGAALKTNPTVFMKKRGMGIGIVALDDLFIMQSLGSFDLKGGVLSSNTFALDKNASYTLEWAVYPTPTADYYDFINKVRIDEKRNFVTVEGSWAHINPRKWMVPPKDYFVNRGLKYAAMGLLSQVVDDPTISLEGIEFVNYPKGMEELRNQSVGILKKNPQVITMFHIAHNLYATDKPSEIFPDSKVIGKNGKQNVYPEGTGYFSKDRITQGWRWWLYYPTLQNSMGKAMLDSVDVMMKKTGVKGCFMDGFFWDYDTQYTYDRWDGHTAEIDPQTKTIKRKMANVLLLSQPLLIKYVRKVQSQGGTVVGNNCYPTRTLCKEYIIHDKELTEGPYVHLLPTTCALGSATYGSETDLWQDIHNKLKWANLYFYYGEKDLVTHPSAPAQMYPITIQELHSGYIKGKERLITAHSGNYGWYKDNDLHFAYLYDGRGYPVPNTFLTTVDISGVRTHIELKKLEMGIIKKVPISLKVSKPVNVFVRQYDENGISIAVNGSGQAMVEVRNGDYKVKANSPYKAKIGSTATNIKSNKKGTLVIPISLKGEMQIEIVRTR